LIKNHWPGSSIFVEAVSMTLKAQILDDVKSAMRARDQKRLTALRLITSAINQIEVDKRIEVDDQIVLGILDKMVKQRRESLEQYESAGRDDLAAQEKFELDLISVYLPEALSDEEVAALIKQAIADTGASSIRDMGTVMNKLRAEVQGRADMKAVSSAVKAQLGA
jgi:uncharacterized protein YqeY